MDHARAEPRGILALQRSLGNAAVVQLLRESGHGPGEEHAVALPVAEVEKEISAAVAADQEILKTLAGFVRNNLSPWLREQKSQAQEIEGYLSRTTAAPAKQGRLYLPYVEFGEKTLGSILDQPEAQKFATLISDIHDVAQEDAGTLRACRIPVHAPCAQRDLV